MDDFINELKQKNKDFSDEYVNMMKQYYQKLMNNPAELQNTLNNLKSGKNGIDPDGGITITPEPYCCVKVQDETGQKIFLNFCGSDQVEPPKEQHILEIEAHRTPETIKKMEDYNKRVQELLAYKRPKDGKNICSIPFKEMTPEENKIYQEYENLWKDYI